jgi:hypothetical protein
MVTNQEKEVIYRKQIYWTTWKFFLIFFFFELAWHNTSIRYRKSDRPNHRYVLANANLDLSIGRKMYNFVFNNFIFDWR